jgi:hypothetical protein
MLPLQKYPQNLLIFSNRHILLIVPIAITCVPFVLFRTFLEHPCLKAESGILF